MHRLEITGETPDALYMNVISTLSLFLRGPVSAAQATGENASSTAETANPPPVPAEAAVDGAAPGHAAAIAKSNTKRGRPAKAEVKAETMDEPLPDLTGEAVKPLTLDGDIRPMLRAIQKAHSERGNAMPACVAYIQKLYGPFGIAKADQLKPESFVEFMEAAKAYLDGEV